ncbi:hypothetical protein, partial [Extibacter muris]|uniref:hypothetical protein n=1 Tax=Extibacter muris TaxID=1796622 RepID=UPI001A9AC2FD
EERDVDREIRGEGRNGFLHGRQRRKRRVKKMPEDRILRISGSYLTVKREKERREEKGGKKERREKRRRERKEGGEGERKKGRKEERKKEEKRKKERTGD